MTGIRNQGVGQAPFRQEIDQPFFRGRKLRHVVLKIGAVLDALGAGAGEAAGGFGPGRRGGEPQLHFGVRLGRPGRLAQVGHGLAGGNPGSRGIHNESGGPAGQGRQLLGQRLPLEGAVDGQGGPAAGGKGLHRALGPRDQVAPGKDPGDPGRQGHRVGLQPEDGGGVKSQAGSEKAKIRGLAQRRDHLVHLEAELGAGHRHRAEAAGGVGLSQFGLLGHQLP